MVIWRLLKLRFKNIQKQNRFAETKPNSPLKTRKRKIEQKK